jgi:D-beta-D-heptose 7-phosphate kinase/D-beta-D-heptose 1-phosphate adenosyltransferase
MISTVLKKPGEKILTLEQMVIQRQRLKEQGVKLVFTNGCFDILHCGHTDYLAFARSQGDALVVGLNSDTSVRGNKGPKRPINNEQERALVLASLEYVDYVVIFDESEPAAIVEKILPDVLVKGEDWAHYVSGREAVERNGGKVVLAKMVQGESTTGTIARILAAEKDGSK